MATWYARNVANANGTFSTGNFTTQAGPTANAAGSLVLSVSGSGTVLQPVVRYFCGSIRMADGTAAPNGITVHLHNLSGLQNVLYPNGLTTGNHPAGHPTYTTAETGWVCFNHSALLADQVNHHLTILPQAAVGLEGGVSIEVTPQTTNNGNG